MAAQPPQLILRLGSHAEKTYIEKTCRFVDGLIVGANLLEATPGATASLIVKLAGRTARKMSYYIDPMTYAFGQYQDRNGRLRGDLDWIKSDQKAKDKTIIRDFKRSYRQLANELGTPFSLAIDRNRAIEANDFSSEDDIANTCKQVIAYQLNRLKAELDKDPEAKVLADSAPKPAFVFAPYLYLEPSRASNLLGLMVAFAQASAKIQNETPVHAIICADKSAIADAALRKRLVDDLPPTGVAGVWLWFSGFHEDSADRDTLVCFRQLVEHLSDKLAVFNMHGGFLSLALSRCGMSGISHGVGYGEQKDVVPVIGQSTPTVRYYLPPVCKRLGVPQIEVCFDSLGIKTPADFFAKVCNCVVCKGVIGDSLDNFRAFGDMHYSTPRSRRLAQTPAAAKRCRFHFLLSRIRERDWVSDASVAEIASRLRNAANKWGTQRAIETACPHLSRWSDVLSPAEATDAT